MKNIRYLSWFGAGFLLNFALPIPDPTIVTTIDVLLANSLVAIPFGLLGLVIAFFFRKKPQGDLRYPAVTLAAIVAVLVFKLIRLDIFALLAAGVYIWSLRRKPIPKSES
ncbi:hypothetical protein [Altererythrobacter sp. MTPC7]|uniref:hypothetical protein n=1 Tax=Altererythrobacter sp. MTPC7 TaxID=3056567 RepID=UPI0036F1DCB4